MEIKPIKSERDYRKALKEIDRLMDARPNTVEGDRLDVLVTLVEAWEEKHWPIDFNALLRGCTQLKGADKQKLEKAKQLVEKAIQVAQGMVDDLNCRRPRSVRLASHRSLREQQATGHGIAEAVVMSRRWGAESSVLGDVKDARLARAARAAGFARP